MLPLLTFASGLVAGVAGVRLLKNARSSERLTAGLGAVGAKGQCALDKAQTTVRAAAISGLSAVERTSARVRTKLAPEPANEPANEPAEPPVAAEAAGADEPAAEATAADPQPATPPAAPPAAGPAQ